MDVIGARVCASARGVFVVLAASAWQVQLLLLVQMVPLVYYLVGMAMMMVLNMLVGP